MKLLLFLISCSFSSYLYAQNSMIFSPINTSNGLSDNRILRISQLNDGRMIFITEGLVNIYNGTEFSYIHYNERKAYPVPNYFGINRTYIDKDNRLWIKNFSKLFLFDLNNESFVPNVDSVFALNGVQDSVSDLYVDEGKNFWYLTSSDNLIYYDATTKKSRLICRNVSKLNGTEDQLYDIATKDSLLYLFYRSGIMVCYDIRNSDKLYTKAPLKGINSKPGNTIVVTYKQYIYQLRDYFDFTSSLVRYDTRKRTWEDILESTWQNSISVDNEGNCLLGSANGLRIIDSSLQHTSAIESLNLPDGSMIKSEIYSQFTDNKGGLWLGTAEKGLFYYHPDKYKFQYYGPSFLGSNISNRTVMCLTESGDNLLVGTQEGLFRYKMGNRYSCFYPGIPKDVQCNTLYKDSQERIWLCTSKKGLYCIDKNNLKHYDLPYYCQNLYESKTGTFYLSTYNGFGVFDPSTGSFRKVEASSAFGWIYELMDFENDKLLGVAYGYGGLFVYDPKNNTITTPEAKENWMLRHSNLKCHDLFTDHRGLYWFGTQDGLNIYDPHNQSTKSFYESDGIVNNNIRSIIEDDCGRIWVSTASGISCIFVKKEDGSYTYTFANFDKNDGVTKNEFLSRSVVKTHDNRLIWGSLDGFNGINPEKIDDSSQPDLSTPIFTKLFLFGEVVKVNKKYKGNIILDKSISTTREIEMKHFQNFLGFEFSALNYLNPGQTSYKYMLEGVDAGWNEIRSNNGLGYVSYTNLSPGTYTLKVYAANNNKSWGDDFAEMTLVINPPIWETPYAIIFYALLFVGSIILLMTTYNKRNKRKFEKKQKEEIDNLKLAFYTNISHELRTPLTLLLTPLGSILKKQQEGILKKQLTGVYRNAHDLLNMVNQLLDFRKLEMQGEKLQLSYCNIDEFFKEVAGSFEELARENKIEFSYDIETSNQYACLDKFKIQKVLNNLISNAFKFTSENGKVFLKVSRILPENGSQAKIKVQVSDTGCGIAKDDLPHIFERFYQSKNNKNSSGNGIGLHLASEYAGMHGGSINVLSQSGRGSTFEFELPVNLPPQDDKKIETPQRKIEYPVKILVIEDNPEFRDYLFDELSSAYMVITASDGLEGLEKAREEDPDLVISDIMMPNMSGTEFCYTLKNDIRISHIPVILLTARISEDIETEGFKVKADVYITKPFNMEILQLQIHNLIERQEKRKHLFKNAIVLNPEITTDIDTKFMKSIIEYIDKNLNNASYSVKQLSNDVCMDRTGLYRKIMAISGQSPSEFLRSVRLKKAAYMLKNGEQVYEVAEKVGFGSTSYFIKSFKKEFGVNPSSYKAAILKKTE